MSRLVCMAVNDDLVFTAPALANLYSGATQSKPIGFVIEFESGN